MVWWRFSGGIESSSGLSVEGRVGPQVIELELGLDPARVGASKGGQGLVDPILQRQLFQEQDALRTGGDDEAMYIDEDYLLIDEAEAEGRTVFLSRLGDQLRFDTALSRAAPAWSLSAWA